MAKIYLSSTYSDLKAHREAAYEILRQARHDVVAMEDYVASDERPLDKCLDDIRTSDLYVGLFAWRQGFCPPGYDCGITELEYREAQRIGLPCLPFLTAEDAPWPPTQMDENLAPIKKLRAQLRLRHGVSFFHDADDLAALVSVAVTNALDRPVQPPVSADVRFVREGLERHSEALQGQARQYWTTSGVVFLIGVALFVFGSLAGNDILMIGAALIIGVGLFPLLRGTSSHRKQQVFADYAYQLQQPNPAPEAVQAAQGYLTRRLAA